MRGIGVIRGGVAFELDAALYISRNNSGKKDRFDETKQ
jgi:hypothetical protein